MNATANPLPRVRIVDCPVALPDQLTMPGFSIRPPLPGKPGTCFRELRIPLWADNAFRRIWATRKLALRQRGFTICQRDGSWWLQQFLQGTPNNWTLTPIGANQLAALGAPEPEALPQIQELPLDLILPELPFGLESYLFEYQRQPARQLYRAIVNGPEEWGYPGAWDCSDMGTGKTYQCLAAALATGMEVGVVCPKSVIGSRESGSGWLGAFRHFKQRELFVINYEALRTGGRKWVQKRGKEGGCKFEWTVDPDHTILIFDEAHLTKNPSLNRSVALAAMRQGFRVIFASGTMAAKPTNLGATGIAVGLHRGDEASYTQFLESHGCKRTSSKTWEASAGAIGAPHLARIHFTVFPKRGARVSIKELGDRFPDDVISAEAVDTEDTRKIVEAYAEAEKIMKALEAQGLNSYALEAARRVHYTKARKLSEFAKVPTIVDMAREELENGRSVVVFLNFTEARDRIMGLLKTRCGIFGGQKAHERDAAILEFQQDRSRIIVCMSQAGGVGVSLHDVNGLYPRTSLICPDDNAVTLGQVLGRVRRAGGKSKSRQVILYAKGTVEEGICANVRGKLKAMAVLNDGDLNPEKKF